jgi:hypothetical protein
MATLIPTVSDIEKHSAAHVLAMATLRVFPGAKVGIGPVTRKGYYYEFDLDKDTITNEEIRKIQEEIEKIVEEDLPFQQVLLKREDAINLMLMKGQAYKAELIHSIPDQEISFFKTGEEFIDLCRGPHVHSTGELGTFRITDVEKVHWNNDPKRPVMQRISGAIFKNEQEAGAFEKVEIEKKKRDFKKYASELGYGFQFNDHFHLSTKGYQFINNFKRQVVKSLEITDSTEYASNTVLMNSDEFESLVDKASFLKDPSFKSLPKKVFSKFIDSNTFLKDERVSGEAFFIKTYSRQSEIIFGVSNIEKFLSIFDNEEIEFHIDLHFHNLDDTLYSQISMSLQRNLISHNKVITNDDRPIEAEIKATDDLGREWLFGKATFNPNGINKEILFNGAKGLIATTTMILYPVNIFAFFIENRKAVFPNLLNPTQFIIIPVSKEFESHAEDIQRKLMRHSIFADIAYGNKSFKSKIIQFERKSTPVILVVGNKEVENDSVSVRINDRDEGLITVENLSSYLESNFFNK